MATTETKPMTVEEFRALPEPADAITYELHHGELFAVTRPKSKHFVIQYRLQLLLLDLARSRGTVAMEYAFRPLPEHELWIADVAFVSKAQFASLDPEDNLRGVPELVIEVLSPSNTASEMYDRERMCLEHGCLQFWVVDPRWRTIRVTGRDRVSTIYRAGQSIPLDLFGDASLAVDDVFRWDDQV